MSEKSPVSPSPALNLSDIYHVLFRHKWIILAAWGVGLAATVAILVAWPVPYKSEAELFVRYVLDNKVVNPASTESSIQTLNLGSVSIINSEVEILGSFDLALQVVDNIGPERILAREHGGGDRYRAAGVIRRGLKVEPPRDSSVIHITFQHPDGEIVQPVLSQLITNYLRMHAVIHGASGGLDDFLTRQTDELRAQLTQTEQDLRKVKSQVGVISLDDSKKTYAERIAKIQEALSSTAAELAERQAALKEMTNLTSAGALVRSDTNLAVQTNVSSDKLLEYRHVCALLDRLARQQQDLLLLYTPDNSLVVNASGQIAQNEKLKAQLETDYPYLLATRALEPAPDGQPVSARADVAGEILKAKGLQARINVFTQELAEVEKQMAAVSEVEATITELQRKRDLLAQNFTHFSASLNNARFDEALGFNRISNISLVQTPTPPSKDLKKLQKVLIILLGGALAGGVALAFVIELYVDRSFKRPNEIETKLGVPLFLSIPKADLRKDRHNADAQDRRPLIQALPENRDTAEAVMTSSETSAIAPWKQNHRLRSYFEVLRDRLILHFEVRNLTHKPKLVAVTSCAEGSGVSTIAGGIAACLSETGEGNVLLVDMNNLEHGAAHYFRKGKLECSLDDALRHETRDSALVQDNLYVVSETAQDGKLPQILHKRFSSLMPRLKASDYDYIIFDMPPVSQISPTTRLARFMDMIFMVVEAEKSDRDVVKQATNLLTESKANVGVILNKRQFYVPRRLQQEL